MLSEILLLFLRRKLNYLQLPRWDTEPGLPGGYEGTLRSLLRHCDESASSPQPLSPCLSFPDSLSSEALYMSPAFGLPSSTLICTHTHTQMHPHAHAVLRLFGNWPSGNLLWKGGQSTGRAGVFIPPPSLIHGTRHISGLLQTHIPSSGKWELCQVSVVKFKHSKTKGKYPRGVFQGTFQLGLRKVDKVDISFL